MQAAVDLVSVAFVEVMSEVRFGAAVKQLTKASSSPFYLLLFTVVYSQNEGSAGRAGSVGLFHGAGSVKPSLRCQGTQVKQVLGVTDTTNKIILTAGKCTAWWLLCLFVFNLVVSPDISKAHAKMSSSYQ